MQLLRLSYSRWPGSSEVGIGISKNPPNDERTGIILATGIFRPYEPIGIELFKKHNFIRTDPGKLTPRPEAVALRYMDCPRFKHLIIVYGEYLYIPIEENFFKRPAGYEFSNPYLFTLGKDMRRYHNG